MTTLITGATGFLGRAIVNRLLKESGIQGEKISKNLVLLGHSEGRTDQLCRDTGIPVFVGDIKSDYYLGKFFREHKIEKIIHTAAIKYVTVSNDNPISTIETNVMGSHNLIKFARRYNVKKMVGISTDKAINPVNVYGMTKRLMEYMFIESGYTIVSGVNFFGSSGSVLDVWRNQINQNRPLTVTDRNCIRYFMDVEEAVDLVLSSFGKNEIIYPKSAIKIRMGDLLEVFMNLFDYSNFEETGLHPSEKLEEDLSSNIKWVESDNDSLKVLINNWEHKYF